MRTSLIGQVPLFAGLPESELDALAATLKQLSYSAGTTLFHEGDHGDRFYIVLDGAVSILKAMDTEDERLVALRGPGEFVGEMSLLNQNGLRTASARVHATAQMLELTRADFDALLQRHPALAYVMLRVLSARLQASHDASIRDLHEKNRRLAQAYTDLQAAQAQIIAQETLAREFRLAREIQESMLPSSLAQLPGFDIGARMEPAQMVGGDFYDVIPLDADRLGIVIGDVAGKGVPAALFMALTCSLLRAEATRNTSPEAVLNNVNQQLLGMNKANMFVTVLYGVLEQATRAFHYVRAGHELPLMWDQSDTMTTIQRAQGAPLGLFPDSPLDVQAMILPAGSTLLLYTDGVTEAIDAQDAFFGLEQLRDALRGRQSSTAQELCDHLVTTLATFRTTAPQSDDITVLAVRAL